MTKVKASKLTDNIFGNPGKTSIFANDHLTPRKAVVFAAALKLKQNGYRFIWTRRGQVYVRKVDEDRAVVVTSISQVDELKSG